MRFFFHIDMVGNISDDQPLMMSPTPPAAGLITLRASASVDAYVCRTAWHRVAVNAPCDVGTPKRERGDVSCQI